MAKEKRHSTTTTSGLAELELGNKWQEAVWGGKAESADDVMHLDDGVKLLLL